MATKRLIDANDALERLEKAEEKMMVVSMVGCKAVPMHGVIEFIKTRPTVDAVEVVHGRWIDEEFETFGVRMIRRKCSECGRYEWQAEPYCHCGAKMDGDGNGN